MRRSTSSRSSDVMVAVDTNVVVRFLTADDPRQAQKSRAIFQTNEVWLSRTVLLETEWVLRGAYGLDRPAVNRALSALCQMQGVRVENPAEVKEALSRHAKGWDFADALHVTLCPSGVTAFYSFDRKLVRRNSSGGKLVTP